MSDEPHAAPSPPAEPGFRTRDLTEPLTPDMKRFDIFLIDTGWNRPVSTMVRSQLHHLHKIHMQDTLYELTPEQSAEVLKHDPALIGHDPTIIVYDRHASAQAPTGNYRGFRLNLGLMRNAEQAMARLQEFIRFIAAHRTAEHLDREVRRELHREGIDGMVRVLRETTVEMLIESRTTEGEATAMNEELPILPLVIGAGLAFYLGYEINRRRNKLRQIFNTFDKQESKIAEALESLVASGLLKPYSPHHLVVTPSS